MPTASTTKATWEDIRRHADQPPADDHDIMASGQANENTPPGHHGDQYPASGANKPHAKVGEEAGYLPGKSKKAMEHLRKSLADPEVLKAMETLEQKGVLGAADDLKAAESELQAADNSSDVQASDEEASDMKSDSPTPADVAKVADDRIARALAPLTKQIADLTKAVMSRSGSESQKSGLIEVGGTAKPNVGTDGSAPSYGSGAKKALEDADTGETGSFDFADLASSRLQVVS